MRVDTSGPLIKERLPALFFTHIGAFSPWTRRFEVKVSTTNACRTPWLDRKYLVLSLFMHTFANFYVSIHEMVFMYVLCTAGD